MERSAGPPQSPRAATGTCAPPPLALLAEGVEEEEGMAV